MLLKRKTYNFSRHKKMEEQIYLTSGVVLVYIMFLIGAVGCFLPIIPGVIVAGAALLIFKVFVPDAPISWAFVWTALVVSVVVQLLDFVLTWYGAKKFGATKWGAIGAFVGVFAGIFIPPQIISIFLAPLVFAFAFEYIGGASARASLKAGFGSFVGVLLSSIIKFLIVVFMAFWFSIDVVMSAMQ